DVGIVRNKIMDVLRLKTANLPTPLERLDNLNKEFKETVLFMKRDDLTGHCFGGNKERKLEFIMADAKKKKASVIVTVGAFQSNHCRMTAVCAARLGMKTELILIKTSRDMPEKEGNYFLYELMNAKIHIVDINRVGEKIDEVMERLRNAGENPYFIEGGGHNVLGMLGYVFAMEEIKKQSEKIGIRPDYLIMPVGTGTTQAGMVLGSRIFDYNVKIIGISISRDKERCVKEIAEIIEKTIEYLGLSQKNGVEAIEVIEDYIGEGYGAFTMTGKNTLRLLAEKEGIVVDPVYNAKALSGVFDLITKGRINGNIFYINTGGLPAIFTRKSIKNILEI
ncbi:MAG: D-cysteine desulfhydrase family protein, partial [bacterium]